MRPSFARRSAAVGFFVASLGVATVPSRAGNARADWNALVDEFFEKAYFEPNPSAATSIGIHKYDAKLEDYSHASIKREIETLKGFEKRVEAFDPNGLDKIEAADRGILLGTVRSSLLSLETIRMWEKDANLYSGAATNSVYVIMNRKFAPVDDRLRSAVAREEQIPDLLKAGRANLKNPPRIYTEIAIEQLPGIVDFFEKDVPTAFADAKDPKIKADFAKSNATVIADLKSYGEWMKSDLLPRSNGDFRFGADTFSKKLLYDEDVDIPLDHLLEIGMADLHKNQAEFQRVAKEIDPTKSTTEVLAELQHIHPAPDKLLQTFRDTFDGLIGFIKTKHIITIPSDIRPILQETPPFERATTTASMDTPGPYEKVATEAYFNVTLPDPGAPPEEVEGMMENFNFGTIISTAIHETYPGHYVQFLWTPRAPTKIRKLLGAATNAEGWAHYCEQMMLDEGYGQPGVGVKDVRESDAPRQDEF
jgi:uncharacterized protein (DUF885 family)